MTTPADLPRPFGPSHTTDGYHHHCWFCGACLLDMADARIYAGPDGQMHVICQDCRTDPTKAAADREQRLREEERYSWLWVLEEDEEEDDGYGPLITQEMLEDAKVEDGMYSRDDEGEEG